MQVTQSLAVQRHHEGHHCYMLHAGSIFSDADDVDPGSRHEGRYGTLNHMRARLDCCALSTMITTCHQMQSTQLRP